MVKINALRSRAARRAGFDIEDVGELGPNHHQAPPIRTEIHRANRTRGGTREGGAQRRAIGQRPELDALSGGIGRVGGWRGDAGEDFAVRMKGQPGIVQECRETRDECARHRVPDPDRRIIHGRDEAPQALMAMGDFEGIGIGVVTRF